MLVVVFTVLVVLDKRITATVMMMVMMTMIRIDIHASQKKSGESKKQSQSCAFSDRSPAQASVLVGCILP